MIPTATHPTPIRRNLYAGVGAAVLGAAALIATISVVNTAADTMLGAATAVTQDSGTDAPTGVVPQLTTIQVPAAPTTCSPASLEERAGDVVALQQARAAEQQAIAGGPGQLADVRSQGRAAFARIQAIDAGCAAG
jgi:hypothetical protein